MNTQTDYRMFENSLKEVGHDFSANPLQYGNEDLLVPELHYLG
jgi:hypothetical protein